MTDILASVNSHCLGQNNIKFTYQGGGLVVRLSVQDEWIRNKYHISEENSQIFTDFFEFG